MSDQGLVLYTSIISPHQLPLAEAYRKLYPRDRFVYLYTQDLPDDAAKRGWQWNDRKDWIVKANPASEETNRFLLGEDVLLSGVRDPELFERRAKLGRKTFYMSERWFKPIMGLPGWIRMLVPGYRKMVKRIVRWANTDPNAKVLAIGPWAKRDFLRIGVKREKIDDWGYFVEPSTDPQVINDKCTMVSDGTLKVLWVGRMLKWKRVDTLIDAMKGLDRVALTLIGQGPELPRLKARAKGWPVTFLDGQPIDRIRKIMREHDVYVLPSDACEGWGVALQEALLEGMVGIGTDEAGSSAALLPKECRFHAGDARALHILLNRAARRELLRADIRRYVPQGAAERLKRMMGE